MTDNKNLNGQAGNIQAEEKKFIVVFEGKIKEGSVVPEVKKKIAELFNTDLAGVESIFKKTPRNLKSNLSLDTAYKYKNAFEKTGALCIIKEMGKQPDTTPKISPPMPIPESSGNIEPLIPLKSDPTLKKIPFTPKKIPAVPETQSPPPPETIPPLELAAPEKKVPFSLKKVPPLPGPPSPPETLPSDELKPFTPEPPPPIDSLFPDEDLPPLELATPPKKIPPMRGKILPKPDRISPLPLTPASISKTPGKPGKQLPDRLNMSTRTRIPVAPTITPHVKIPEIKRESPFKRLLLPGVVFGILIVVIFIILKPGSGGEEKKTGISISRDIPGVEKAVKQEEKKIQAAELITFTDPNGFYSLSLPVGFDKAEESSWERSSITFSYSDRTSVSIVAYPMKEKWDAEAEMKKKVKEIESGTAGTLSLYRITGYKLITIADVQGYDLTLVRTGILSHYYYLVEPGKNAVSIILITEGVDRQEKHNFLVNTIEETLEIY